MNELTAWDYECIADMAKSAQRITKMIAGKLDSEMVRSPLGDSRPESVSTHKAQIRALKAGIARILSGADQ